MIGKGQTALDHAKAFAFYSKDSGKPLNISSYGVTQSDLHLAVIRTREKRAAKVDTGRTVKGCFYSQEKWQWGEKCRKR